MSTGDQTQYIRTKLAERGSEQGAHFMMDGFDRWAESNTPARAGQEEKMPAETQMVNYGGAMTLSKAKRLQALMNGMHGGRSVNIAGIPIEVPDFIFDGIEVAKKLLSVAEWAVSFVDEFAEDLTDNVIDKPEAYSASVIADCKELITVLKSFKPFIDSVKWILKLARDIGVMGSGRRGGKKLVGGDWAATFEQARKTIERAVQWYTWFKSKANTLKVILKLQSVQKVGGQKLLDYLTPIFDAIGFGRHGGALTDVTRMGGPMTLEDKMAYEQGLIGAERMGGPMTAEEKMQYMSPEDKKYLMDVEKKRSQVVGGRRGKKGHCCCDDSGSEGRGGALPILDLSSPKRKVGGIGSLKKLETLLKPSSIPKLPPMPKFLGGTRGAEPRGLVEFTTGGRKRGAAKQTAVMEMAPTRGISGMVGGPAGGRRKVGGASCGGRKPSARGEIVKKVMREQGLSLPQASKYVKEHGLYPMSGGKRTPEQYEQYLDNKYS